MILECKCALFMDAKSYQWEGNDEKSNFVKKKRKKMKKIFQKMRLPGQK
jgi:hypothetical protein